MTKLPAKDQTSRRAALRLFAAAPALAILPAAIAAAAECDPVFAAIERHRAAWRAFSDACELTDEPLAKEQGREVTEADEAVYEAANKAEKDAMADLLSLAPVTIEHRNRALHADIDSKEERAHSAPLSISSAICSWSSATRRACAASGLRITTPGNFAPAGLEPSAAFPRCASARFLSAATAPA